MRTIVQEEKYEGIKQLLKDIIEIIIGKSEDDKLNIDLSVYSTGVHKMRMVGQYKKSASINSSMVTSKTP